MPVGHCHCRRLLVRPGESAEPAVMFTIEDAKRAQRDLDLGTVHIVYIDPDEGFVMAHTDAERASGMSLLDCEIHKWLATASECHHSVLGRGSCCFPELPGWYVIRGLHNARGLAL